jgi:hypothetical protein
MSNNLDFEEIISKENNDYTLSKKIVELETAKRHVIKLSDITANKNEYKLKSSMKSKQLINSPTNSIAVFCNEYVPEHFPEGTYINYILNINGDDHDIVPINSQRNGKKIIRTTENAASAEHVLYIKEPIKSAYLIIAITTPNKSETPFVSNIKILAGDN